MSDAVMTESDAVAFDHRDAGTPEEEWRASDRWASVPWSDARGFDHALVVAAHPDDETLGAGALLARLRRAGTRVTIVLATRGEGAYSVDTSLQRVAEFHAAVSRVAPECTIVDLGLPDGGLRDHESMLESGIRACGPADLVVAPWRGDAHGDHDAAGDAATRVASTHGALLLEYPVWLWHWAAPHDPRIPWSSFVRVPQSGADRRAKNSALESYASQSSPPPGEEPILHTGMLAHFTRDWETFVRTEP